MNDLQLWERYKRHLCVRESIGLRLDISRMSFADDYLDAMASPIQAAMAAMQELERGKIANRDENRMVGHYWLRAPDLAPSAAIGDDVRRTIADIQSFASAVHNGDLKPQKGDGFYVVLLIGIGGSALGPLFVADALGGPDDPMMLYVIDNTDPDGIDRALAELEELLDQTLTIVVSKSGGTIETRNAMLEVSAAYRKAGLRFADHAVAVTMPNSTLHRKAVEEKWLRAFPLWDWVGGRTSELSAVGLLPAALQGLDVEALLAGARECDEVTRNADVRENPAALLALMWYHAAVKQGRRTMVVLPYRDRLALLGRYLQQLVMESLGKERDRAGNVVHQGLTVYGNKGSTDQHAFVQQLQEGPSDFFVTFVEVLRDRAGESPDVEEDVTTGDYLHGFLQGTRSALFAQGRESITLTLDELNAHRVGAMIALWERAVGLYAELINVNAYHQPGVEAGKKAAGATIALQRAVLAYLRNASGAPADAETIAAAIHQPQAAEAVYHLLEHTAANPDHLIQRVAGAHPTKARYSLGPPR